MLPLHYNYGANSNHIIFTSSEPSSSFETGALEKLLVIPPNGGYRSLKSDGLSKTLRKVSDYSYISRFYETATYNIPFADS